MIAVIPAFNESKAIGDVIDRTLPYVDQVVVVNDGSWDETDVICRSRNCIMLTHRTNQGVGAALKTGIRYVQRHYPDSPLIILDGDGQHFPEDIPSFLRTQSDVVIGTRFGNFQGLTLYKRSLNVVASLIASMLSRRMIVDSESGFRYFNKHVVPHCLFWSDDYAWATEQIISLAKQRFTITFIPIRTVWGIPTRDGQSRRGFIYGLKVLYRLLLYRRVRQ